jgi:hypothetical protein
MFTITPLRAVAAMAAFAVVVSGSTIALGAIGDGGQIAACVNDTNETWSVSATGSCKSGDTVVSWSTKSGADAALLTQSTDDGRYFDS